MSRRKKSVEEQINSLYNTHHRRPKSRQGSSKPANLSVVPIYKHVAFHQLFGNMQPSEIAAELSIILASLNTTWIDPDYILIAVRRQ